MNRGPLVSPLSEKIKGPWPMCQLRVISTVKQRAKKTVSYSPGLEDFSFGPVNFVLNLPNRQDKYFRTNVKFLINLCGPQAFSPPFENVKSVKASIKTSITLHFMLDYMLLNKASKSPKAFDKSKLQCNYNK